MVQGGQGLCTKKSQHIWAGEDKWVGSGPEWAAMHECGLAACGRKGQRDEQESQHRSNQTGRLYCWLATPE